MKTVKSRRRTFKMLQQNEVAENQKGQRNINAEWQWVNQMLHR